MFNGFESSRTFSNHIIMIQSSVLFPVITAFYEYAEILIELTPKPETELFSISIRNHFF